MAWNQLKKSGQAWILSAWQIVVNRYPKLGERIRVSTWATDCRLDFSDLRNFKMRGCQAGGDR